MQIGTQWLSNVCLKNRPCKDFFLDCCDHRWWGRIARWCGESRNGPIIAARSNDGGSDSLPPRSPQMRTFFRTSFPLFPPSLSHAAEALQLVRSQYAVNILINVNILISMDRWSQSKSSKKNPLQQYVNLCQRGQKEPELIKKRQRWGQWLCCYCLCPRNEILSLLWFLLEKLFFFCWKSSWNILPKTFCLPSFFGDMYTLPETAPRRRRFC